MAYPDSTPSDRGTLVKEGSASSAALSKFVQSAISEVLPRGGDTSSSAVSGSIQQLAQPNKDGKTSSAQFVITVKTSLEEPSHAFESFCDRDTSSDPIWSVLVRKARSAQLTKTNPRTLKLPAAHHVRHYVQSLQVAHRTGKTGELYDYTYLTSFPKMLRRVRVATKAVGMYKMNLWEVLTRLDQPTSAFEGPIPAAAKGKLPNSKHKQFWSRCFNKEGELVVMARLMYNDAIDRQFFHKMLAMNLTGVDRSLSNLDEKWNELAEKPDDRPPTAHDLHQLEKALRSVRNQVKRLSVLIEAFGDDILPAHLNWLAEIADVEDTTQVSEWRREFSRHAFPFGMAETFFDKPEKLPERYRGMWDAEKAAPKADDEDLDDVKVIDWGGFDPKRNAGKGGRIRMSPWASAAMRYLKLICTHEWGLQRATAAITSKDRLQPWLQAEGELIKTAEVKIVEERC